MLPQGGGMEAFGPGAPPALGTGMGSGQMDAMGQNPGDPMAQVQMEPMAPMGGPSIAEALQQAVAAQMQEFEVQKSQEQAALLMQSLQEAQVMLGDLIAVIGGEAQTLDGAGNVPQGEMMMGGGAPTMGGPPMGAPGGQDLEALMAQG